MGLWDVTYRGGWEIIQKYLGDAKSTLKGFGEKIDKNGSTCRHVWMAGEIHEDQIGSSNINKIHTRTQKSFICAMVRYIRLGKKYKQGKIHHYIWYGVVEEIIW